MPTIRHILVANRGEIARRVFRTCRALGITTTAVYSTADRLSPHVREADHAVCIGAPEPKASYLDASAILAAARKVGADAIHPGYGFLSERADFADAVIAAGLVWIGPPPSAMRALGDKAAARRTAQACDVPVVPGFDGANQPDSAFQAAATEIGFPVLIKAANGGGGRGMRRVDSPDELIPAIESARREAGSAFGSEDLLLERYVLGPRHIEIQVFGDHHGNVIHLGERECSIQRRHQKIIEEAPSSAVSPELRERIGSAAVRVAKAAGYACAGTVEFLLDAQGRFYLLEMNARLQVEHPVTEAVTGLDLVALQIAVSEGKPLPLEQSDVVLRGHAIEARLCAEDPMRDFLPASGPLIRMDLDHNGVRVDSGYEGGLDVPVYYDSMIAKLIAFGPDRASATRILRKACESAWVPGVATNLPLLRQILGHPAWESGALDTGFLARTGLPTAPPLNLDRGALAAAVVAWHSRNSPGSEVPQGFRLEGPATEIERYRCGAEEIEVHTRALSTDLLEVRIGWGIRTARLLSVVGDRYQVELDGAEIEAWRVARERGRAGPVGDGELLYVHLGDGESFVQLVPRFAPPVSAVEPGSLVSPTPGKVVQVAVAVGDAVEAGRLLVVLEAMKMEHRVTAPEAGTVAQVRVAVGDTVDAGALLVRIE